MTPDQIRSLTWTLCQIRDETHGCAPWDAPGTHKAVTEMFGSWGFSAALDHCLPHARDPKARTPYAMKGTPPRDTTPERHVRYPPKPEQECGLHIGEWADNCRTCHGPKVADDDGIAVTQPARVQAGHPYASEHVRAAREAARAAKEATT